MPRETSIPRLLRRCLYAAIAAAAASGCRSETANPEEILKARSLGTRYLERNQLKEAEEQFKLITSRAPKDPFGYANLALTYIQAGPVSYTHLRAHETP